jgi:hypothetical protein
MSLKILINFKSYGYKILIGCLQTNIHLPSPNNEGRVGTRPGTWGASARRESTRSRG